MAASPIPDVSCTTADGGCEVGAARDTAGAGPAGVTHEFFSTAHLRADLKGRFVRGGATTLIAQAATFLLKLGSITVLARLLAPEDFGLVAMVVTVTGFVEMFRDAGLSTATIQRAEITHAQVSTLFWINVALGVTFMLTTAALAPPVAWFYREPRLIAIMLALSPTLVIGGLAIQHQALLYRQMRFGTLASIQLLSQAAGLGAAIVAAVFGLRYWALVVMLAGSSAVATLLTWLCCDWRPGLPRRGSGVRPLLSFGLNLAGFNLANHFFRKGDNIIVGWFWGPGLLGLYDRAYTMVMLPLSQANFPLWGVAVPALSATQSDPARYVRGYLQVVRFVTLLGMPLAVLIGVMADEIVLVVFGPAWLPSASILRILSIGGAAQVLLNTAGILFVTSGRTDRQLRQGLVCSACMLAGFLIGVPFGGEGVAAAFSLVMWISGYPLMAYAARATPVRPGQIFRAALPATCLSLITGAVLLGLQASLFRPLSPWLALGLAVAATAAVWILFNLRRTREEAPLHMILNALRRKSVSTAESPRNDPLSL